MLFKLFFVILAIIILFLLYNRKEDFANTENRKIYNLFKDFMNTNGTYHEFNMMLNQNKIRFSEAQKENMSFEQYMELVKNYNRRTLNPDTINYIRSN